MNRTESSILRDAGVYAIARGIPAVLSFAAIAVLTRLLSPEVFGLYTLVMAGVGLSMGVAMGWLRAGLLRYWPTRSSDGATVMEAIRTAFVAIGVVASIVALAGSFLKSAAEYQALILLGLVLFWVHGWFEIERDLARVQLKPWRYGRLSLARAAVFLPAASFLAFIGWGGEGVILGSIAACGCALLFNYRARRRVVAPIGDQLATLRTIGSFGAPLAGSFVLWFAFSSMDRFMLAGLVGTQAVGLYSAGFDLIEQGLGLVMLAFYLAILPVTVRTLGARGAARTRQQLVAYFGVFSAIVLPAGFGVATLAPDIASVVLGEAYRDAAISIMPWAALGAFLIGYKLYYVDIAFLLAERTRLHMAAAAFAAVANVGLNVLLIPTFGILGAAIATVISAAAVLALSWRLSRAVFGLPLPWGLILRPLVASLGMALALRLIGGVDGIAGLLLKILVGVVIYFSLLLLLDRVRNQLPLKSMLHQLIYVVPACAGR